jgi:hypothetical protein
VADEDARQLHRTWETLQGDRTRVINRLKAVLAIRRRVLFRAADLLHWLDQKCAPSPKE